MHILDIILGIFLLLVFLHGLRKGLIKSVVGLVGLLIIVLLIAKFGSTLKLILIERFNLHEILATIFSYLLIALVISLIIRLIIALLHSLVDILHLGFVNRLLGGALGFLSGAAIIAILLMLCDISPFYQNIHRFTSQSVIVVQVRKASAKIQKNFPQLIQPEKQKQILLDKTENLIENIKQQTENSQQQMEEFLKEKQK